VLLHSILLILVYTPPFFGSEVRKAIEKHQEQTALKLHVCEVIVSPVFFVSLNDGRRRNNKREEWIRQKCVSKDIVTTSARNAETANLASEVGVGWYMSQEGEGTVLVHVTDL